jgi:hypothetical protein
MRAEQLEARCTKGWVTAAAALSASQWRLYPQDRCAATACLLNRPSMQTRLTHVAAGRRCAA